MFIRWDCRYLLISRRSQSTLIGWSGLLIESWCNNGYIRDVEHIEQDKLDADKKMVVDGHTTVVHAVVVVFFLAEFFLGQ